jgi:putative DNA primase/helicase
VSDTAERCAKAELLGRSGVGPLVSVSSIKCQPLRWLWPYRVPLGKLTILAGDPGLGKSLLLLDLAARVSCGHPLPDGDSAELGDVIVVSAEDDPADTIRPRLEAAGADLERVHILRESYQHFEGGKHRFKEFSLDDLEILADALDSIAQRGRAVRLMVIDPISAYLGGLDGNDNGDIRGMLRPLAELAAHRGVAIIGLSHLRKGSSPVAIYRVIGSLAFAAAARAVHAVVRDPADKARRLFLPVKCNLGPDKSGLAYRIEGGPDGVPRMRWEEGRVELEADALLGDRGGEHHSELEEAADFLRDILADGPIPAVEIPRRVAETGISMSTVNRAKQRAGVVSRREGTAWVWALQDCQGCQDSHTGNVGNLDAQQLTAEGMALAGPAPEKVVRCYHDGEIDYDTYRRELEAAQGRGQKRRK